VIEIGVHEDDKKRGKDEGQDDYFPVPDIFDYTLFKKTQ
jgi:hypothetical protein